MSAVRLVSHESKLKTESFLRTSNSLIDIRLRSPPLYRAPEARTGAVYSNQVRVQFRSVVHVLSCFGSWSSGEFYMKVHWTNIRVCKRFVEHLRGRTHDFSAWRRRSKAQAKNTIEFSALVHSDWSELPFTPSNIRVRVHCTHGLRTCPMIV